MPSLRILVDHRLMQCRLGWMRQLLDYEFIEIQPSMRHDQLMLDYMADNPVAAIMVLSDGADILTIRNAYGKEIAGLP